MQPSHDSAASKEPQVQDAHPGARLNGPSSSGEEAGTNDAAGIFITEGIWRGFPRGFEPLLRSVDPARLDDNDRIMASLLAAAPARVVRPPIQAIPTSRDGLLVLFRDVCIQLTAYPRAARKFIIKGGKGFTLDHLFLLVTIFRYPDSIDAAAEELALILAKMLSEFLQWTATWNAQATLASYADREVGAAEMSKRAMRRLATQSGSDLETKWLYSLLRAIGHLPEVWGFPNSPDRADEGSNLIQTLDGSSPTPQQAQGAPRSSPLPPSTPSTPSASSIAQLRQGRVGNDSRSSLGSVSVSSLGIRNRNSFYTTSSRMSRFQDIIREEQGRILAMEFERDLAKTLIDTFYRSLLTLYSHQFLGSEMSREYLAVMLRYPNVIALLIVRSCEHMHRELDILSELLRDF